MKKIFTISLVALLSFGLNAQTPAKDALQKVEKAEAAAANPKAQTKAATWQKLATEYFNLFTAEKGAAQPGMTRQLVDAAAKNDPVVSEKNLADRDQNTFHVVYYDTHRDFYREDVFQMSEVIKHLSAENPLAEVRTNLKKVIELDPKKAKEVNALLEKVATEYYNEGIVAYTFGEESRAASCFHASFDTRLQAGQFDTLTLNNAAIMAVASNRYNDATNWLETLLENGFSDGGSVYERLSRIAFEKQDTTAALAYLEKGFIQNPKNQAILIGLINYYLTTKTGTDRLFDLVQTAIENEPENGSLYWVKGNVYKELKDYDKAYEAYMKAAEVNKTPYEWGYIGAGQMYYDLAVEYSQAAASEMDDAKYQALQDKANEALKAAIVPFEKAFETTVDPNNKIGVSEYLKNIFYRFSSDSDEMYQNYKKYNEFYKAARQ